MKWAKEDVDYMIENYPKEIPMASLCRNLNRSKTSITHKAARLSLSRPFAPSNKPKDPNHRKIIDKAYYENNKKKITVRRLKSRRDMKKKLVEFFGGGCNSCGYSKCLAALEFHHKSGNKEAEVTYMIKNLSREKAFKEASKCIILCSNCHRELHNKGA